MSLPSPENIRIGVIGLGYVGLPLAVYMARHFPVTGFDANKARIAELNKGIDRTREITETDFRNAREISYTHEPSDLGECNFLIVTVPTPIDVSNRPDLSALKAASRTAGAALSPGNVVVYESTVFPGATEEICVPILEETSGLTFNRDFFAGYSPERINPGDQKHRLPDIVKVTAGSTPEVAELVDAVYSKVITAGVHRVSSIRVAEAAKVIENIQRDVNIALVNELAMLFKKLSLDTHEVLAAAGTKWNFHGYHPGLVGGHCIGVDPYYLTHKAQSVGFHPEMILAGRRINDSMAKFVALDIIQLMVKRKLRIDKARILVLGFAFKENCPDTRNTKVADLVRELRELVADVVVFDPLADAQGALEEYGIPLTGDLPEGPFDAVVLAVNHDEIARLHPKELKQLLGKGGLIYDIKCTLPAEVSDARL